MLLLTLLSSPLAVIANPVIEVAIVVMPPDLSSGTRRVGFRGRRNTSSSNGGNNAVNCGFS
jgi:hypothetical protein